MRHAAAVRVEDGLGVTGKRVERIRSPTDTLTLAVEDGVSELIGCVAIRAVVRVEKRERAG